MSWVYIPQCSACSPDTEGSKWASTELSEALERSAWWKGKPSPSATWSRRWKRAPWLRLLSGLTCPPSTAENGVIAFLCSLEVRPASHSAPPASDDTPTTSAGYGQMSLGLSERSGPASSSSRTCPASASEGSASCSETLPLSGSMGPSGVVSQPPRRAHRTDAPGSSSWPTPTASSYGNCVGGAAGRVGPVRHSLNSLAKRWPTPCARDHKGGNLKPYSERGGGTKGEQLPNFVRHHFHQVPTTPTDGDGGSAPVVLNPEFVEALMLGAARTGFTAFACSATGLCPCKPSEPFES